MPIQIKCQCGKVLKVKDELAGKAVKCPGCGKPVRVGKASAPAKAPAPVQKKKVSQAQAPAPVPVAKAPAPVAVDNSMDALFDEAGFSEHVAQVCPSCRQEMASNAVFCTNCGFNKETGEQLESHKTAGVDIDHGTLALDKAAADLDTADRLQKEMESKAGMPWWMLALVLFMIGSGLTIAVIVVNASNQVDQTVDFNPVGLFLRLGSAAFGVSGLGALLRMVILLAKKEGTKAQRIKLGIAIVLAIGIAIGMFVGASNA